MNILVCVKQVPDTTEIKINPETNTLIRAGVPSIVNPFDAYALEAAARIKDAHPQSKIVVVCMGPAQARAALQECLSVGGDRAYLVSDRAFGGSDTLATSYILSCAIARLEELEGAFDIILCGKQAIDGDTGQVGPELAEHLDCPQATCAVDVEAADGMLKVRRETDEGYEVLGLRMPCVVTVTKPAYEPRYPTIKSKMAARRAEIPVLDAASFPIDLTMAGLKGSPTKVIKTFTPPQKTGSILIHEASGPESAAALFRMLNDANVI